MEKIREDIKNGTFEKVYLLYGEETYLVLSCKKQLKDAIIGDDAMNFSCFEGKGISLEEVQDIAATLPFFADRRLILLEDTGLFKGSAAEGWVSLAETIPDGCHIIFAEREVDKRSRMYKAVNTNGYCAEMQRQSERDLKRWIVKGFASNGLKITEEALDLFFERTGDAMEDISTEMEKVSAYCLGKEGVVKEDVEAISSERVTGKIFDMVQAVAEGKPDRAIALYGDLLVLKEPGMRILFLIARQMNQLLCVKTMTEDRVGKDQIAKALQLKPFIAGKLIAQARLFDGKQLKKCLELCVDLEESVKNGNMAERIAVEMVFMAVSKRRTEVFG